MVIAITKNNAPIIIVEGIKNEELSNVHVVATRMKPIDLDKTFEGGTFLEVNIH